MKILKFGGTSIATAERMHSVVDIIDDGQSKIVVLSAMEGVTDSLTQRGNLLQIYSCGAYGEVMASSYNLRGKANSYYSDAFICEGIEG